MRDEDFFFAISGNSIINAERWSGERSAKNQESRAKSASWTQLFALITFYFEMIAGIIGAILAILLILNGWSGLRKSLDDLMQYDPIGKLMYEKRGAKFTLRVYRIMGASMLLLGLTAGYLSVRLILAG